MIRTRHNYFIINYNNTFTMAPPPSWNAPSLFDLYCRGTPPMPTAAFCQAPRANIAFIHTHTHTLMVFFIVHLLICTFFYYDYCPHVYLYIIYMRSVAMTVPAVFTYHCNVGPATMGPCSSSTRAWGQMVCWMVF